MWGGLQTNTDDAQCSHAHHRSWVSGILLLLLLTQQVGHLLQVLFDASGLHSAFWPYAGRKDYFTAR